jgi:hypothetical protein
MLTTKHSIHLGAQLGSLCQVEEELEGAAGHVLAGKVEVEAIVFSDHGIGTFFIFEEVFEMILLDFFDMFPESNPLWRVGNRNLFTWTAAI